MASLLEPNTRMYSVEITKLEAAVNRRTNLPNAFGFIIAFIIHRNFSDSIISFVGSSNEIYIDQTIA